MRVYRHAARMTIETSAETGAASVHAYSPRADGALAVDIRPHANRLAEGGCRCAPAAHPPCPERRPSGVSIPDPRVQWASTILPSSAGELSNGCRGSTRTV